MMIQQGGGSGRSNGGGRANGGSGIARANTFAATSPASTSPKKGGGAPSGRARERWWSWAAEMNEVMSHDEQAAVLSLFGRASVVDGATERLVITRAEPTMALAANNCAVLTLAQAQELASTGSAQLYFTQEMMARCVRKPRRRPCAEPFAPPALLPAAGDFPRPFLPSPTRAICLPFACLAPLGLMFQAARGESAGGGGLRLDARTAAARRAAIDEQDVLERAGARAARGDGARVPHVHAKRRRRVSVKEFPCLQFAAQQPCHCHVQRDEHEHRVTLRVENCHVSTAHTYWSQSVIIQL